MKAGRWMMTALAMLAGMVWAGTVQAGSLTPPAAPGSTMKTLTEVHDRAHAAQTAAEAAENAAEAAEPRTAISGAVTITQPGSYYLSGNITGQITIQANNVTLDLMGFRIERTTGSAIVIPNGYGENTLIRNGTLRPGSNAIGLDARYSNYCRFEDLRIEGNNAWCGIYARDRSLVRDCDVRGCNNYGIYVGDHTEVRDNRVAGGALIGIRAGANCRIEGNRVDNHGGRGIHVQGADTVLANNTVRNNNPDFDLHAQTVQVPSTEDLQQQIVDLKRRMGAYGMAETVGGMVLIPAGPFQMGDAFTEGSMDERPVHTVTVSAFYIDQYEVTKAQWDAVYAYATASGYTFDNAGSGKGASHPVHMVNWFDCVKWANARSERDGLTPVYYVDAAFTTEYRTGTGTPYANWSANGYRLPTEAEWEKAARGGVEGRRYPWAEGNTITHTRANYYANPMWDYDVNATSDYHPDYSVGSTPYTSPVGSFAPNGYGLYDMAGNVWEWCWDWYDGNYYAISPASDPRGSASVSVRVLRGGSWYDDADGPYDARVAYRGGNAPGNENVLSGFRCARGL